MGAKYTEAQRRATENYQKTLSNIGIRVKKEDYAIYKAAAGAAGQSLRDYIITAISEKMERDGFTLSGDGDGLQV